MRGQYCFVFSLLVLYCHISFSFSKKIKNNKENKGCSWDKDADFPTISPLLFDVSSGRIVLPVLADDKRMVNVEKNSVIIFACPESSIGSFETESVEGKCTGNNVIKIENKDYSISDLGCAKDAKEMVTKCTTMSICGDNGNAIVHTIGFKISAIYFYDLIEICFDHLHETTLYTKHTLRGGSLSASETGTRPSFKVDSGLFTENPNNYYSQTTQEALMMSLLGKDVIDSSASLYFARGHLSPDADFVLHDEAQATYYYINAVPQWQSINNGNWKKIEFSVRDLAEDHGTDIQVWTGTSEVLKLKDVENNDVDILLGLSDKDKPERVVPAPCITWKVIYEESSNSGAALVVLNNPYLDSPPEPLCEDICDSLTWLSELDAEVSKGVSYCCTVEAFHAAIPNTPDLGTVGLLTA